MNGMISIDTNIFIYYFQQHFEYGPLAKTIFEDLTQGKSKAVTSIITLIELLAFKASDKDINILKNLFLQTPNLTRCDLTQSIGLEAARIRRSYGFRLPDAIQLATAIHNKSKIFITNDIRLKSFKELKVITLSEYKKICY